MLRMIAGAALAFCLVSSANAVSFELSINGGYGFASGAQSDLGGFFWLADYKAIDTGGGDYVYSEWDDKYASFGNGAKVGITGTIMFNDNAGLLIDLTGSFGGGAKVEQEVRDQSTGFVNTDNLELDANHLAFSLGLKLKATSKIAPYVYLAPSLVIPLGVGGTGEEAYTGLPTDTEEYSMAMAPGFGFSGGLGVLFSFSDLIGLSVECAPSYAFARIKEVEITYSDGTTERIVFENDEPKLPPDVYTPTSDTWYTHGRPSVTFSSIAAKLGLVFSF